ncbi:MAG: hypothetical protein IPM50_12190 [Acidobacteriota bacterium]|nr:MAG: hypothetical protein IPM50_12190 [Acidobacteriota bacterium]
MRVSTIILSAAFLLCAVNWANAQETAFSDPSVEYTFSLPDPKWKLTLRPTAANPNVEFVHEDRLDCHLQVRRLTVTKEAMLADLMEDEEQRLQIRPGFVAGREENFAGRLRGSVFNFEYLASGRSMAGRFYFLRSGDNVVYTLRFTGQKDIVRSLRNQLDSIARSFGPK